MGSLVEVRSEWDSFDALGTVALSGQFDSQYSLRISAVLRRVAYYNEHIVSDEGAHDRAPIDHDAVVGTLRSKGLAGLNNGLSDDENRLLLSSPSMQEVLPVLLKGLRDSNPFSRSS